MSGRKFYFRDSLLFGSVYFSAHKHACPLVIFTSISRKQSVGVFWKSEQGVFQRTFKGSLILMRASRKCREARPVLIVLANQFWVAPVEFVAL